MGKRRIDLSGTKVAANVLATVTGATAASYFGVAGTITGTVVMSVASSAGTTVYQHYLNRGHDRVRRITPAMVPRPRVLHGAAVRGWEERGGGADPGAGHGLGQATAVDGWGYPGGPDARAGGTPSSSADEPAGNGVTRTAQQPDVGFPAVSGGLEAVPGGRDAPGWKRLRWGQGSWRELDWKRVAVAAAATLVLAIVVISAIELAAGRPLGAIVGGQHASGTSVGNVFGSQPSPGRSQSPSGPRSTAPGQAPAQPGNTAGPAPAGSQPANPAPSPAPTAPVSPPAGGAGGITNGVAPPATP